MEKIIIDFKDKEFSHGSLLTVLSAHYYKKEDEHSYIRTDCSFDLINIPSESLGLLKIIIEHYRMYRDWLEGENYRQEQLKDIYQEIKKIKEILTKENND